MNRTVRIVLMAVVVLVTPSGSHAQSGADRFQQALKKERVDGDLKGAIALYQQILKEQKADRSLSAKVLLQLGAAYEKQGSADAKAAYQRIVRDYSDQTDAASAARARLATLSPAAVANGGTTVRRIWAGADIDPLGAPTRDGRLLTFVDWQTGDLAVRDLASGQNRRITNKGTWATSPEFALFSVPSPDGRYVAYTWFNAKAQPELRIIGTAGESSRVLFGNAGFDYEQPYDWSPDGKLVLAMLSRVDHSTQIGLISTADGSVRVLKTLDWRGPGKMSLSPDGKYVLYDAPPSDSTQKRDVYILASDGSAESVLVKHSADDQAMGWSPDGRYVLFSSDRTGSTSQWIIAVANGKGVGEPTLLRRDAEKSALPMGFTNDGAFMYSANRTFRDIYLATIDPATGKLKGQPTRLVDNFVGSNQYPEWSPDGSEIVFTRQTGPLGTTPHLIIRSLATGVERLVPANLGYIAGPRFTPDGRRIVARGRDLKGREGLFLVDCVTGKETMLLEGIRGQFVGWADGGKSFIYRVNDMASRSLAIVKQDIASGEVKDVFRQSIAAGSPSNAATVDIPQAQVSPRGEWVAFALRMDGSSALRLASVAGAESRELFHSAPGQDIRAVAWSADGRGVFFTQRPSLAPPSDTTPMHVMRISVTGGAPEETGLAMENIFAIRAHPDGKRILFTGGAEAPGEVWVMENFLPKAEGGGGHKRSR